MLNQLAHQHMLNKPSYSNATSRHHPFCRSALGPAGAHPPSSSSPCPPQQLHVSLRYTEGLRGSGLLGIAVGLSTTGHVCHEARHTNDAYQLLKLVPSANQQASSHDGADLLANPIEQRGMPSSTAEHIKEVPHYNFSGHDGPGTAMTLNRKLFFVLQGKTLER
ncbi:uncharacterized protein [Dermacentor albipictus]|uniref:uncharacterized protein n=1 Tax=Dermacentor albipictus TaxID=60249 RepID=UPI0038FD13CD